IIFPNVVAMLVIAVMMFGFIMSTIGTIGPAMTSALFGGREYSQIYSTASVGMAIAGIISLPSSGYIFDCTYSYTIALYSILIIFPIVVAMLVIAVMMFGFIKSTIGTIGPAMTSALFGGREYSQIYSTASVGMAIAGIIALPAYGYIFDFTGSYTVALYAILI